jgi:hypothetical protein
VFSVVLGSPNHKPQEEIDEAFQSAVVEVELPVERVANFRFLREKKHDRVTMFGRKRSNGWMLFHMKLEHPQCLARVRFL